MSKNIKPSFETDRAIDLANAWEHSRKELVAGRIGSLEGVKERRLILKEAEEEGLLDRVMELIGEVSETKYQRGDDVYWNDPDAGACSGGGKFLEYKNQEIALIEKDGVSVEVYVEELS